MNTTPQTGTCLTCRRPLRSAASVARGRGPVCAAKARKAARAKAVAAHKPEQVAKATELIDEGGIVPIRGRHIFRTVSSDGTRTYLTAAQACNCAAGLKGRHVCFHRIAAQMLLAA